MEELSKELAVLKAIDSIPLPPPFPAPGTMEHNDGTVKIPFIILEYFKKCNAKFELDKNGRIPTSEYCDLLDKHHVATCGIRVMTFRVVTAEDVRERKKSLKSTNMSS